MDPSDVQFVAARPKKRSRHASEMPSRHSQASRRSSSQSAPGPSSAGVPQNPRPSPPRLHYPGDGLDFRRPVVSDPSPGDGVIDLTNEPDSPPQTRRPQPPGLGRDRRVDVVDLEAEEEEEEEEEPEVTITSPDDPPSSPEVQFMGASSFGVSNSLLRMLGFHSSRLPERARGDILTQVIARRAREIARHQPPPQMDDVLWMGGDPSHGAVDLTLNLDVNPRELERHPPPARAYKPPSPVPEGFTRTVGDEDVVCCPNCDAELGVGSEIKQQIWVVKQCGHVYCGECATHRSQSKAKKNSASHKTKPFAKCLVDNCGKAVSQPRSMFQVYL
ncbi:hypothetical protein P168DRAFT_290640 [Aspergillus campestris IBT 28561]|uniref:RING-type domain-containing protein n=1 Tax=Aspergillus campestris (strain IBT 28561) TaxID=1392248 RepID=A0A2I1D0U0_ASPC2|nr:uncharacterized protein P168DRAFT_290640 [Aspergillus campestris IBT 28561]PKY03472.1 hypothetical protein P168DRAFT_290640 [Aspergillus campestris IBT 28561]